MPDNTSTKFPKGLLLWAGHREGGVKKPFIDNSGRPTGEIIRTHLLDKIDDWINALTMPGVIAPRALLMIGGPGNGKTEAVEYFIGILDQKLKASGTLLKKCKEGFTFAPNTLPSRKVKIHLQDEIPGVATMYFKSLAIVHDATVGDNETPSLSPERLLVNDLREVNDDSELLYIACINRGILSQALDKVTLSDTDEPIKNILVNILSAVTLSPEQPSCWPLDRFPFIAVWPMDIESLVDSTSYEEGITPAHHIFKRALDRSSWILPEECPAGKLCPFHTNLELLSEEAILNNLIKILRQYEISSGKRWTFRDLFSLVSQLLVGHEDDFRSREKEINPCDWAAAQVDVVNKPNSDTYEKTKARFLLSSKIYSHVLFPRWPDLRAVRNHCKQILKRDPHNDANAHDLFRLIGWLRKDEHTLILNLIGELGVLLDPVETSGSIILAGDNLTADTLEETFSYSVQQGYSVTREYLSEAERAFIEWIIRVEERIAEDTLQGNKNLSRLYDEIRKHLRLFACRLAKRSLGVKKGITKENNYLERYARAIHEDIELKNVRKQFRDLIHENSRFPISLTTTFGQPVPHPNHDAKLYTPLVQVTYIMPSQSEKHARSSLPYMKIKDYAIPLTYDLFKALVGLREGLMEASIPPDILALIEGTRARIAGDIVRSEEGLEDAILSIGKDSVTLTIHNNIIKIERSAPGEF